MSNLMTAPQGMTAPQLDDENDAYGYISADYDSFDGEQPDRETERQRYDEQILAALVTF